MFFKKNHKIILFPLLIMGIVLFDQLFLLLPLEVTALKVLFVGLLHIFLVIRTKYLNSSDIFIYLSDLKLARERNFIIKPILS